MYAAIRPRTKIPDNKNGLCAVPNGSRRIGLLGGTFNPPHDGHLHLSRVAMRMLKLDAVWWLVSPGNPLKANPPPPLDVRMADAQNMTRHDPRILVTDFEAQMGTRYSIDTVRALRSAFPNDQFVWICGSDIAHEIHRWREWRELVRTVSFACVPRPPSERVVGGNHIRMLPAHRQAILTTPAAVPLAPACWYWILNVPRRNVSSTLIRSKYGK